MNTNHNRIKVADLEKNDPNKTLITNANGELEFSDITDGGNQGLQSVLSISSTAIDSTINLIGNFSGNSFDNISFMNHSRFNFSKTSTQESSSLKSGLLDIKKGIGSNEKSIKISSENLIFTKDGGANSISIGTQTISSPRVQNLPDKDGTFAMLDDISGGGSHDLQSVIENGSFATLSSGGKVTFEDPDTFNQTEISGDRIEIKIDDNGDSVSLSPNALSFTKSDNYVLYNRDGIKYTNDDGGLVQLAFGDIIQDNNITLKIPSNLTTGTYTFATLEEISDNFVHKTGEVTEIIDGNKIFRFPATFRGDASSSYIRIDSDYLTFTTELYDNNSIKLIAKQNSGAENENYTQELQAKDGIIALLSDLGTPVSATTSGVVNNTSLQELGGVDKLINSVRIGKGAGTGEDNTAIGVDVLQSNTASYNTGVGNNALHSNTTGNSNVATGAYSMANNTTGNSNVGIGEQSLYSNQFGNYNTAIGAGALYYTIGTAGSTIYGHQCTAIGAGSMAFNTTGTGTAVGAFSLYKQTTGTHNLVFGFQSGGGITTGNNNTIIAGTGFITVGGGITTGSNNLIVAQNNGNTTGITTGSGNTVIGKVTGLAAAATNTITIADGVGNIALAKSTAGEITVPNLTNALITSGGNKSLLTLEYLSAKIGTTAPTSATAAGTVGEIRVASGYIYWCTAPNTWIRAAGSTF